MWTRSEYEQLMKEAIQEFKQWEKEKKKVRKATKAKYKAQRLDKLEAQKLFE